MQNYYRGINTPRVILHRGERTKNFFDNGMYKKIRRGKLQRQGI